MTPALLRPLHLGVLAALAASALLIVRATGPTDDAGIGATDRRFTLAALGLGVTSILARRQAVLPGLAAGLRVPLAAASLLAAGSLGALGVALAWQHAEREASLLYVLGGAILALRPPLSGLASRRPSGDGRRGTS